jgi:hypothetical protein
MDEIVKTLRAVDAAIDGLCPCGAEPRPGSVYCSPDCEPTHRGPDTDAPYLGGPHAARWRPDLVAAFDESGLTLLGGHHRDDTGLDYCVFTRGADDDAHLRVDDGHRFVGMDVPWSELEVAGVTGVFRRLERELTDRRRLDPDQPAVDPWDLGYYEWIRRAAAFSARVDEAALGFSQFGQRLAEAAAAVETEQAEQSVLSGGADPRAEGAVFWLPQVTDPQAPTLAELTRGVELGRGFTVNRIVLDETRVARPERESAAARFRELGGQIVAAGTSAIAAFRALPAVTRRAIGAERDRAALRAVCVDEAMYQRAVGFAGSAGITAGQMAEHVAAGRYTEHGWSNPYG